MLELITKIQKDLESIKRVTNDGDNFEFWSARELMKILDYKDWRKFREVIEKAKISCKNSDKIISDHFVPSDKMVLTGYGARLLYSKNK